MSNPTPEMAMQATAQGSKIVFRITVAVWSLVGLDDDGYADQTYPSYEDRGGNRYAMSRADLAVLLGDIEDRANPFGSFEHNAAECRALRLAAENIRALLTLSEN